MLRIIDGLVFEGRPVPDTFTVTYHGLGHGHREVSVMPVIEWKESCELDPDSINGQIAAGLLDRDPDEVEERRRFARLKSARRAKTKVRRLCKVQGLDVLMTLTYRANQTDLALCKRHLELFRYRMGRMFEGAGLGRFLFVAAFEPQGRGAWHVHLATRRVPPSLPVGGCRVKSFDAVRAVWRAVVGDLGGNVDIGGKRKRRGQRGAFSQRSPAKCAAYLSKYMLKDWETWPEGVRRFQASQGAVPAPTRVQVVATNFADLIELCYSYAADGKCDIVTSRVGRFGDSFYLASERRQVDRSTHCRAQD